jgi:hypothetical protein
VVVLQPWSRLSEGIVRIREESAARQPIDGEECFCCSLSGCVELIGVNFFERTVG